MKTLLPRRWPLFSLIGIGVAFFCRATAQAEEFEAVFSKMSNGYIRTTLPDGSFQPETYTLLKGGLLGGDLADPAIDKVSFDEIAQKIAGSLASRNYVPSRDPKTIKLLIVVFWGTTLAPEHHDPFAPLIEGELPPFLSESNPLSSADVRKDAGAIVQAANLLGYRSPMDAELQSRRYFVVLLAYDFQMKLKQERTTLLWETRFSIREQGNEFDKQLPAMVANAAQYFGQDSHGLTHEPVPEGHVVIGEIKSLDVVTESEPGHAALAPDGTHVAYLKEENQTLKLVIVDIDWPKRPAVAEISNFYPVPTPLKWADAGHVLVPRSATESISFNLAGKRSEPAGRKTTGFPPDDDSHGISTETSPAEIQALVDGKLPDRRVIVLAADETRRRFLLVASGGAGSARYFVFDRPDDLLYEVGRR